MQTIGERLEEARKRQNITLREASDATKVRVDFLTAFERNEFTIDLPEIYRKGFLKIYATFLKMDVKKIMLDYAAVTAPKVSSRGGRHLGRMELEQNEAGNAQSKPSFRPAAGGTKKHDPAPEKPTSEGKPTPMPTLSGNFDSSLFWKVGLILGGGFLAIIILILAVGQLTKVDDPAVDTPTPASSTVAQSSSANAGQNTPTPATNNSSSAAGSQEFTLVATGPTFVSVKEVESGDEIFRGPLDSGDRQNIVSQGPARITYTQAEYLQVVKDGQTYRAAAGSHRMNTSQF